VGCDREVLLTAYERLRAEVLARREGTYPLDSGGLALFVRHGMLGWVKGCCQCTVTQGRATGREEGAAQRIGGDIGSQVAMLLATMVLSCRKQEGSR